MSGIFRSVPTETGSIRAETGSLRPPRIDVFALPPLCSPSSRARATGRAVKLRKCPFEVVLSVLVAASPDAAAICEAVTRPHMRFVPITTEDQQAVLMLHKARELLVRQHTMLINTIRGHMTGPGMIAPRGSRKIQDLAAVIQESKDLSIPALARADLRPLVHPRAKTAPEAGWVNGLLHRRFVTVGSGQ